MYYLISAKIPDFWGAQKSLISDIRKNKVRADIKDANPDYAVFESQRHPHSFSRQPLHIAREFKLYKTFV